MNENSSSVSDREQVHSDARRLSHVHLQWFADPDDAPLDIAFQDDETEENDPDVIEVDEDAILGKGVTVIEDDPEDEEGGERPDDGLAAEFAKLNENLGKLVVGKDEDAEEDVPEQKPGESDEEFWKRMGGEMFDEATMPKAMQEAIGRTVGPQMTALAADAMEARKEALQAKDETKEFYEDFGPEIEREAKKLLKQHGPHPRLYRVAYDNVRGKHGDYDQKKLEDGLEAEVERRVAEKLGEAPKEGVAKAQGTSAGAVGGSSSVGVGKKVKRVKVTPEIRDLAKKMGVYNDPKRVLKHFGG